MINTALRFGGRLQFIRSQQVTQYVRVRALSIKTEHINIPIGGRGSITLDISHAIQRDIKNHKILISLPPGPIHSSQDASSEIWRSLVRAKQPSMTLINLNYRLSAPSDRSTSNEMFQYPQPIHDCSVAFSQILTKVIPRLFPTQQLREPWDSLAGPRIGLIGTHIGAALATMLALTNPNNFDAVAIADPLVDWVILDELTLSLPRQVPPSSSRSKRSSSPAMTPDAQEDVVSAARHLIDMRTKLFPTPSMYFDPFASPTLFLRAPGRDTPRTHAEALGMIENENDNMEPQGQGNDEWEPIATHEYHNTMPIPDIDAEETMPASAPEDLDTLTEAMGTDSFGPYDDDIPPSTSPSPSPSSPTATHATALSSQSTMSPPRSPTPDTFKPTPDSSAEDTPSQKQKQIKRRKVLRRWPPNNQPDVLLPYFQVYVSPPSPTPPLTSLPTLDTHLQKGLHAITTTQAAELSDLLRRACFYGREKGFAEERVNLIRFSDVLRSQGQGQGQSQKMAGGGEKEFSAGNDMGEEVRMELMLDWLVAKMEEGNRNDSG